MKFSSLRRRQRLELEAEKIAQLGDMIESVPQVRAGKKIIPPGTSRERLFLSLVSMRNRMRRGASTPQPSESLSVSELADAVRDDLVEAKSTSDIAEQYFRSLSAMLEQGTNRGPNFVPYEPQLEPPVDAAVRLIAFYLTQFHPIPENDEWWGRGFTEWTGVSKAVPQFAGHYQPHLPDELGFYDLRVGEVQERQVEIARQYGIHGFAFYYYWFAGRRLLERPLDSFLTNPRIKFPFCLIWANENWTRKWDGRESDILLAQEYSPQSDLRFIEDLSPYLENENYIRVDGRPLIGVYRPDRLPNPAETLEIWRGYCVKKGFGNPIIVAAQTFGFNKALELGFDAAMQFPPHNEHTDPSFYLDYRSERLRAINPRFRGMTYSYPALVKSKLNSASVDDNLFETAFPMWDNTPRVPEAGLAFMCSSPELYKIWLQQLCQRAFDSKPSAESRIVFLNAWNEWAEGAHLEPDRRYGFSYLKATREALDSAGRPLPEETRAPDPVLEAALRVKPHNPILIYDMGHVGLARLYESISDRAQGGQVLRIRRPVAPEVFNGWLLRDQDVFDSEAVDNWFRQAKQSGSFKIITAVRDPIERNVSAFLDLLPRLMPNLEARFRADDITAEELHELFLNFFDQTTPARWFGERFEPAIGLDVFATPFPQSQGYEIYKADNVEVLLLRHENLAQDAPAALRALLGPGEVSISTNGTGAVDDTKNGLTKIFDDLPLPQTYVDPMFETRYATHFYSPEEIYARRRKWLRR